MAKLKIAVLEDNQQLLKDLIMMLEETKLVEIVAFATTSEEFLEKVEEKQPEALLLDIDLGGDSMNGIDIAKKNEKLPVLFLSGKTAEYTTRIEEIDMDSSAPVFHITKPVTESKLRKILSKLIDATQNHNKKEFVFLDFKDSKRNKISVDDIVYIETAPGKAGTSQNKLIHFVDREPETVFNLSFSKLEDCGLDTNKFLKINRSQRVNKGKIMGYPNNHHHVLIKIFNKEKVDSKQLSVSEDYRKYVKDAIKNSPFIAPK